MICIFKCPHCGSIMRFSPETQLLICDSCNSEIPVYDYNEDNITYEGAMSFEDDVRKFECPNCGSQVITETNTAMIKCNYCGDELAAIGMSSEDIMPEKIIPLNITERQAQDNVIGWWLRHESMPELDMRKMKMEFHDMYIPVWLYDVDTVATVKALVDHDSIGINQDILSSSFAVKSREKKEKTFYDYVRETNRITGKYQPLTRFSSLTSRDTSRAISEAMSGTKDYFALSNYNNTEKSTSSVVFKVLESTFQKIPYLASSHFSGERFHGIEPYNYYGLKSFRTAYLSGHHAENYEFTHEEMLPHLKQRIQKYALEQCHTHVKGTVPGGEIAHIMEEKAAIYPENVYYALVPIWICSYYYAGKKHYVYVNGQTGKTDGEVIFASKTYGIQVTLYGLISVVAFMMMTLATCVILFDFANALVYGTYLLIKLAYYLFPSKKSEIDPLSLSEYRKNAKMDVKTTFWIKIIMAVILFMVNALMYMGGIYTFKTLGDNMFFSCVIGIVIAGISTFKFAVKRRKDMIAKEEVEYKDYIMEAGTKVIASVRS